MTDLLIIKALAMESQNAFTNMADPIIYTGVGKVNAAYKFMRTLREYKPKLVLNLGTAGSPIFNSGSLINCTKFIQRDMDVTPLGFEAFQTPFDDDSIILENGLTIEGFQTATCGSGDSFDTKADGSIYQVSDMEAYVLAKICAKEHIPFICIKFISDGANGNAANDWQEALDLGAIKLREAYEKIRQTI